MIKKDVEGINRMRMPSIDKGKKWELELDNVLIFWLKVENNECYDGIVIYTRETPAKEEKMAKVMEAKQKELQNLFKYDVF